MSLTRRGFLGTIGAGAGTVALAACAPAAPSGAAPQAQVEQPKYGGTLVGGRLDDLPNTDPHVGGAGASLGITHGQIFERLLDYDANLKPIPELAESWELSSDGKQIKFSLRKGAVYHSGRDFTSDDVKWTVGRVSQPKINSYPGWTSVLTATEIPDKSTIVFKFSEARPQILDIFAKMNIADQQNLEGPDATKKAAGTGPFMWDEWKQGSYIRFKKNPNYWQSGRPYLDAVEQQVIPDPAAMVVASRAAVSRSSPTRRSSTSSGSKTTRSTAPCSSTAATT